MGALQRELERKKAREKELADEIRSWAEAECKPGQAIVYEGQKFAASVTAKANKRRITAMLELFGILGKNRFLSLCGFTLDTAEKNLTPAQFSEVVTEEANTGRRTVETMPRAVPGKAARKAA